MIAPLHRRHDRGTGTASAANADDCLSAEPPCGAANARMNAYGGYRSCNECDIERKFRETHRFPTPPIANNIVLAFVGQHVLGIPGSY